jgi:amidase
VWTETGLAGHCPHPQVVERTAALLRELGHEVREVAIPAGCDEPVRRALRGFFASSVNAAVSTLVPAERKELLLPYTRILDAEGGAMSGSEVLAT